jgi:hypothetical protein
MPPAPVESRQDLLLLAVGLVLARLALRGAGNGDSGLYHEPLIRWSLEYPIVTGLGNLHVRFAFNQSYFLYAAMLGVGPLANLSAHLANGLFMLAGQLIALADGCEPRATRSFDLFVVTMLAAGAVEGRARCCSGAGRKTAPSMLLPRRRKSTLQSSQPTCRIQRYGTTT